LLFTVHEYAKEGVPEQFSEAFALKVALWQVVVAVGDDVGEMVIVEGAAVKLQVCVYCAGSLVGSVIVKTTV
jgi:hypothetical protein